MDELKMGPRILYPELIPQDVVTLTGKPRLLPSYAFVLILR